MKTSLPLAVLAGLSLFVPAFATQTAPSARRAQDARQIELPGSPTKLLLWNEPTDGGELVPHYRISLDGSTWSRDRETSYQVRLRFATFDPLVSTPDLETVPLATGGELYLVQYHTQPLELFRETIEARGGQVYRFLSDHTHIARLPGALAQEVAGMPFVRWVGPYQPAYRLDPQLLSALEAGSAKPEARYIVQVMERGPGMKAIVAERIVELGGSIEAQIPQGFMLEANLTPAQLAQVVTFDEVLWVDPWRPIVTHMEKVRVDGGANFLESVTGFTGQGVAGEALDTGVLVSHSDFSSVLLHNGNNSDNSHGTSVAGIVFGDGSGDPNARGMLPDGKHVFSSVYNLANRYTHTAELLKAPYRCVFQTNSWGFGYGDYDNNTTTLDDVAFQYDILICQAQGNSGGPASEILSWAKNVLSVGGIRHQDTQTLADDSHGGNSGSTGPATDGRIKPDLSFWYDSIRTTSDSGGYTSNFGGTSAATPETAGHVGLFMQMWHMDVFGTSPGAPTVFGNRPKGTTAKAFMINSADQYTFSGGTHDLRRVRQGWGRANVERLYEDKDSYFVVNEDVVLQNLATASFNLVVPPGQNEFRATLVYNDLPGTTSAAQHRINDLSLRVTAPDGSLYWGNRGMKTNMFTKKGGSSNTLDTVENVWVNGPQAGAWLVEVLADEINQDSHVETGALDADFALVVSGVTNGQCPPPANYCTTSPNSVGPGGVMGYSGSASLGANDLVLDCDGLPASQFGLFFYGPSQQAVPVGDGTLCVGGSIVRLPVQTTSAGGTVSQTFDAAGSGLNVGDTANFQFWYRDPTGGPAGNNFSDGLSVTFCN
jgi:Subtilase family